MAKITFSLLIILVTMGCAVSKNGDYKIYCKDGDKSSIRIIPKKDPFTPILDSIRNNADISIANLKSFEPKVKLENKKVYNEKIKELDNSTFINLTLLKSYYIAYRSQPCEPKAYNDYILALNSLTNKLSSTIELKEDIEKLTKGSGISGNTDDKIMNRLSTFFNTIK